LGGSTGGLELVHHGMHEGKQALGEKKGGGWSPTNEKRLVKQSDDTEKKVKKKLRLTTFQEGIGRAPKIVAKKGGGRGPPRRPVKRRRSPGCQTGERAKRKKGKLSCFEKKKGMAEKRQTEKR